MVPSNDHGLAHRHGDVKWQHGATRRGRTDDLVPDGEQFYWEELASRFYMAAVRQESALPNRQGSVRDGRRFCEHGSNLQTSHRQLKSDFR